MVRFKPELQVINKKDQKEILTLIKNTWGADFEHVIGFGGVKNQEFSFFLSQKDRIYLATRSIEQAPLKELRINSVGCYIGEYKGGDLRLSIEGTQLVAPLASTNIVELTALETEQWMKGEMIQRKTDLTGFVLLKHGKDWLGCGKAIPDGRILNFIPKTRRITAGSLPSTIPEEDSKKDLSLHS